MAVRPFRLWPERTRQQVSSRLAGALARWEQDWGVDDPVQIESIASTAQREFDVVRGLPWNVYLPFMHGGVWMNWDRAMHRVLSRALYPVVDDFDFVPEGLAASAAEACLVGLPSMLATESPMHADPARDVLPPAQIWQPGSGALLLTCRLGDGFLRLLLDEPAVAGYAPLGPAIALPRLAPVLPETLFANLAATVRISAGSAKLSITEMAGLGVGDVIAFDHPLDDPLQVTTQEGAPLCGARALKEGEHLVLAMCAQETSTI